MKKSIYVNLAWNNIRKNKSTFFPFCLACTVMIAMFYIMQSIWAQVMQTGEFFGAATMSIILEMGVKICGFFSVCIIFYTNSFLLKRRTKELGLYRILGLEQKHVGRILFWEMITIGVCSLIGGIAGGMLLSRFMYLLLVNMVGLEVGFSFFLSVDAIAVTGSLFIAVFVIMILYNRIRLIFLKPIEMVRNGNAGEKEPKAKWLQAILGLACLAGGYAIAVVTKKPLQALEVFFVAVLLVVIGTYLLFMSGSIAFLKLLKKNKRYYYHKTHFITVSGMIYRMKQNAVGLANICILSTMVLVVLSSTVSLYVGMDDIMRTRFPRDVAVDLAYSTDGEQPWDVEGYPQMLDAVVKEHADAYGVVMDNLYDYYEFGFSGTFENGTVSEEVESIDSMTYITIMENDAFHRLFAKTTQEKSLAADEAYLYFAGEENDIDVIYGLDKQYKVVKNEKETEADKKKIKQALFQNTEMGIKEIVIVVSEFDNIAAIYEHMMSKSDILSYEYLDYNYEFDLQGELQDKQAFCNSLWDAIQASGVPNLKGIEDIFTSKQDFINIYGSLFFIGIFIGTLFLMTTVLIIYYKQVSEGYEDRTRFEIMQKVGMDGKEVKKVIGNQVLTVFFLPILLAIVHIIFAFGIITKLLAVLNLTNVALFCVCTIATILIFLVIYSMVYGITSKTYYKLIRSESRVNE